MQRVVSNPSKIMPEQIGKFLSVLCGINEGNILAEDARGFSFRMIVQTEDMLSCEKDIAR